MLINTATLGYNSAHSRAAGKRSLFIHTEGGRPNTGQAEIYYTLLTFSSSVIKKMYV